jgi:hypothetical protein
MKQLSLKKILDVRCPRCGAAVGEKCELNTGQPRTDPHRDRFDVENVTCLAYSEILASSTTKLLSRPLFLADRRHSGGC